MIYKTSIKIESVSSKLGYDDLKKKIYKFISNSFKNVSNFCSYLLNSKPYLYEEHLNFNDRADLSLAQARRTFL